MPDAERATVEGHEAAVIADSVSRIFGPLRAVDRLSVVIPRGVIYGLLGPSGSGKTTFLRMVVGALRPSEGRLWVFGTAMPSRRVAQRIGYMPQAPALYPDLTLRENLRFFGAVYRVPRRQLEQRIEELATDLDLLA